MHWRRNIFNVPFGEHGSAFVDELASLITGFAENASIRAIAWKAVVVACHLLLQRPNVSDDNSGGSSSNFAEHLHRRLGLWKSQQVPALYDEAACIQAHLPTMGRPAKRNGEPQSCSDRTFANLVFSGKIQSASRYISSDACKGVLRLDDPVTPDSPKTVKDVLLEKHPKAVTPPTRCLLEEQPGTINPIIFDSLTAALVRDVGRRVQGSAGPSGLDADAWKRMLTCFKKSSERLCSALAAAARCLCMEDLTQDDLSAFTAARLIPLDKNPGVRPIAVGEVFRRIICKAIMGVIELDVLRSTAPYQICVGVPSACEAAVHSMDKLFRQESVQGILLVDASNAFNSLNRAAALHNIPRVCPSMAQVFANTYTKPVRLFVDGDEILSEEGTCQGDPLAMAAYAVAIMPLINTLEERCQETTQCWFADDDGAASSITSLRDYWNELSKEGPGYGYFPNAKKTVLLVKPEHRDDADRLFSNTGINIRSTGCRYLGGSLGEQAFCEEFMKEMVQKWCQQIRTLAEIAHTQPHAAYAVFTRSVTAKWRYHIRTTASCPEVFNALDEVINTTLLPAFTGRKFEQDQPERAVLALPARLGGLAVPSVAQAAERENQASRNITEPLVNLISAKLQETHPRLECQESKNERVNGDGRVNSASSGTILQAVSGCRRRANAHRQSVRQTAIKEAVRLKSMVPPKQETLLSTASEKGVSTWLTADPLTSHGTVLNKSDFRDAVCLRYGYELDGLSSRCVCGQEMSHDHALSCPTGGYPSARHNEIRDILADTLQSIAHDVEIEPVLLPFEGENLPGRTANRSTAA